MNKSRLRTTLEKLMEIKKISDADLSRNTGIAQATIHRLKAGTTDPKVSTLEVLAEYFDVEIGQLLGKIPLDNENTPYLRWRPSIMEVPLISFSDLTNFGDINISVITDTEESKVVTNQKFKSDVFALKIDDKAIGGSKYFGSIIIVDPAASPGDGNYIVVRQGGHEKPITIKKIVGYDSDFWHLVPIDNEAITVTCKVKDAKIYGVIKEFMTPV